ncbi:DMT family transporter [Agromyces albus]|uniref:DMT family transporter n=1 Tax=Agromyces albus TaxID=205332 RepID=A0A4Q2L9K4_9MICO|nr:DMT family transporter [Agromyces albus]RXZ73282.1 DMT family transporter [Agromyces albus]
MTTAQRTKTVTPLVYIAIGVTILAWASAFIVVRSTAPHFTAGGLALGRLIVGSILLAPLLLRHKWIAPTRREWLLLVGFGALWFGAYSILLNLAEQTLDAGTTAMIVNIGPILIALGAGIFLGEGLPRWLLIGTAVAFLGVVLIGVGTGGTVLGAGIGVFWALLAALTYAAGVLFQKPVLARLPNAQVVWLGCVIGMVVCIPFTGEFIAGIQAAPVEGLIGMIWLGAIPTALGYTTWSYALSRMPAGQLGVSTHIVPPVTIVLSLILFAEVPALLAIVGGVIALVGVALSRRRVPSPEPAEVPAARPPEPVGRSRE